MMRMAEIVPEFTAIEEGRRTRSEKRILEGSAERLLVFTYWRTTSKVERMLSPKYVVQAKSPLTPAQPPAPENGPVCATL